jgi:hypothetical protein
VVDNGNLTYFIIRYRYTIHGGSYYDLVVLY